MSVPAASQLPASPPTFALPLVQSLLACALFGFLLGAYIALAPLQRAVHGSGVVSVAGQRRSINHERGGVIAAIHVTDGQAVTRGEALITLDASAARIRQEVATREIDRLQILASRLHSELASNTDERAPVDWVLPTAWQQRASDDALFAELLRDAQLQRRLRIGEFHAELAQIDERLVQIEIEKHHADERIAAQQELMEVNQAEITEIASMVDQQLLPEIELINVTKERASLRGSLAALAQTRTALDHEAARLRLQARLLSDRRQSTLAEALAQTRHNLAQAQEEARLSALIIERAVITAPLDGLVHDLRVHTIGSTVTAGAPLLDLVPQQEELIVIGRISPDEIEIVHRGMPADIRFLAFSQRSTEAIPGEVIHVGADRSIDQASGRPYYEIRVAFETETISDAGLVLHPGMRSDLLLIGDDRSLWRYLADPILKQMRLAFREE